MNNEELRQEKIKQIKTKFPNWEHYSVRVIPPLMSLSEEVRRDIIIDQLNSRVLAFLKEKRKKEKVFSYMTIFSFVSSDFSKEKFILEHKRSDGQYVYNGEFCDSSDMIKLVQRAQYLEGVADIFMEEDEWNTKD